ncbi:uncharacterized protein Hap1MRO34_024357 [Clarias gariepinus]
MTQDINSFFWIPVAPGMLVFTNFHGATEMEKPMNSMNEPSGHRESLSTRRKEFPYVKEDGEQNESVDKSPHNVPEQLQIKAAHRVGEGVPFQQVPDARSAAGDRESAAAS